MKDLVKERLIDAIIGFIMIIIFGLIIQFKLVLAVICIFLVIVASIVVGFITRDAIADIKRKYK